MRTQKPISDAAARILSELAQRPGLASWFGGPDPRVHLIGRLVELNEPLVIPRLLSLLLDQHKLSPSVESAIARLLDNATSEQYVLLATWFGRDPMLPMSWRKIRKQDVASLCSSFESPALIAALLTMHHNGHVREAAVQRLAEEISPMAIPFLIMRANDWAAPVRLAAYKAIRRHFAARKLELSPSVLALALRLLNAGRYDHSELVTEIVSPTIRDPRTLQEQFAVRQSTSVARHNANGVAASV